jgi:hypothetical protein
MARQLEVIKSDGSFEEYLHTKVLGAINNAFDQIGQTDVFLAQELADVVTYYAYHKDNSIRRRLSSSEILSIVKVVLTTTDHGEAAAALSEHHYARRLKRRRIDVVSLDIHDLSDAQQFHETTDLCVKTRWDKSRIAEDLIEEHDVNPQTARAIASMVEEKIFKMDISLVPGCLIRLLVLSDTAMLLRVQDALEENQGQA